MFWRALGLGLVQSLSLVLEEGGSVWVCAPPQETCLGLAAPHAPEEPAAARLQPCLALSPREGRTVCTHTASRSPDAAFPAATFFPHEIPDLVCCVFLKTHPRSPKTSAGEGETFLVELPVFETVSDYAPPPLWPGYTILSINSLSEGGAGRESVLVVWANSPKQIWKLRLKEAEDSSQTTCRSPDSKSDFFFNPGSRGQAEATFAPQTCFLWPEGVLICGSCQHL